MYSRVLSCIFIYCNNIYACCLVFAIVPIVIVSFLKVDHVFPTRISDEVKDDDLIYRN